MEGKKNGSTIVDTLHVVTFTKNWSKMILNEISIHYIRVLNDGIVEKKIIVIHTCDFRTKTKGECVF